MNSLDRFSVLTNEQASTTVGGSWQTELAKFIVEQAANHIDDIVKGFNAGNHRHRPQREGDGALGGWIVIQQQAL